MAIRTRPAQRGACAVLVAALAALAPRATPAEPASAERAQRGGAERSGRPPDAPVRVLVRLRADGPHAVTECAEAQQRSGRPLAAVTRDRSDSLDRLHDELRVRAVRAVFRRADGRPFAAQRAALSARARARRSALPRAVRSALAPVPELAHVYRLELAPGADAVAAAARYAADPHVVWAQPSADVSLDLAADDPFLASSGSWGQSYEDLWGILRIGAPAAWDLSQGDGVVVAVVDSGIDTEHPDLAANLWVNPGEDLDRNGRADPADRNGVDDDGNGFIDDLHGFDFANSLDADDDGDFDDPGDVSDADPFDDSGHGTHIAGTAAAVANNRIGVAGVAPRARLMAVKAFRASGPATDETLARAMVYAAQNGARVINNSWSCTARCPSNPLIEDAQAFAASLGVVVVTSAGNRSDDVVFYSPKHRRDNIVVGASDPFDEPAHFTNTGYLVSAVAPGTGEAFVPGVRLAQRAILSTRSSGASFAADGGGAFVVGGEYLRWSGTSMSAPHVAGIAALILAIHPEFSPDDVRAVIRSAARDLGAAGHDRLSGAGLADAARAVAADPPSAQASFSSPPPGAVVVPDQETIVIRGELLGDVSSAALSVGFGRDPDHFDPIPLAPVAGDRELARWDVSALDDGPYLLRLAVRGADGSGAVEFLPLSLERNPPTRLSSPGADARAPAISGERVVWQSERALDGEALGLELFVSEWSSGEEWRAVSGPGDQFAAALSRRRLAWLDARDHPSDIRSCRLNRSRRPCQQQTASAGPESRAGLAVSGDTLVWHEWHQGPESLRGCTWRGASCRALALPSGDGRRQVDPILRGTRLWWQQLVPTALLTCVGFPRRCAPVRIEPEGLPLGIAGSRSRLAWALTAAPTPVNLCRVGDDGACPARRLGLFSGADDVRLAVSRHRVVWSAAGPGGDSDIFFCEDDPHTDECPVQRLTGSAADQRDPDISGARVVWEDDRDGAVAIAGLELPSLDPIADRRAQVGRRLRIAVRGRDPSGGALALDAVFADGTPLAARGAAFRDRGDGTGVLTWRPDRDDVGAHVITFVGRSAGRLFTRRSARIEVELSSPRGSR